MSCGSIEGVDVSQIQQQTQHKQLNKIWGYLYPQIPLITLESWNTIEASRPRPLHLTVWITLKLLDAPKKWLQTKLKSELKIVSKCLGDTV